MPKTRLLIIEGDALLAAPIVAAVEAAGAVVQQASSCADAAEALSRHSFDLVVVGCCVPDASQEELLRVVLGAQAEHHVLVVACKGITVAEVARLMRAGATDVQSAPLDPGVVVRELERLGSYHHEGDEVVVGKRGICRQLVGKSSQLRRIVDMARAVAPTDASVLIMGESGTGKELLAEAVHYESRRKDEPFIRVNCAAIPENLLESELFGVEAGAFTDARKSRGGYLEEAEGGTLFLDEIGDLPLNLQVKLLRALGEKTIHRVGGTTLRRIDFRLITATNRNLEQMVREETFRDDLFFRINVIRITMPALRERREDIPILLRYLTCMIAGGRKAKLNLSPEALDMLYEYDYPGNIRELKNIVEHLLTLYPGVRITPRQLTGCLNQGRVMSDIVNTIPVGVPLKGAVAEFEKRYIDKVLASVGGSKGRAAEILGLSRKTLWLRMKELGLAKKR